MNIEAKAAPTTIRPELIATRPAAFCPFCWLELELEALAPALEPLEGLLAADPEAETEAEAEGVVVALLTGPLPSL